jgi:hypothetical protein
VIALFLFYFLAAVSIWLGLLSLRGGVRFVRYVQSETAREYPAFTAIRDRHCSDSWP